MFLIDRISVILLIYAVNYADFTDSYDYSGGVFVEDYIFPDDEYPSETDSGGIIPGGVTVPDSPLLETDSGGSMPDGIAVPGDQLSVDYSGGVEVEDVTWADDEYPSETDSPGSGPSGVTVPGGQLSVDYSGGVAVEDVTWPDDEYPGETDSVGSGSSGVTVPNTSPLSSTTTTPLRPKKMIKFFGNVDSSLSTPYTLNDLNAEDCVKSCWEDDTCIIAYIGTDQSCKVYKYQEEDLVTIQETSDGEIVAFKVNLDKCSTEYGDLEKSYKLDVPKSSEEDEPVLRWTKTETGWNMLIGSE